MRSTVHQLELNETTKQSLKWLLFYMLAVIVVCLTAFNFYLFCWIWSSLSGGSVPAGDAAQWPKLDLFSSWDELEFEGRLASRLGVQVGELRNRANDTTLRLSSPNDVQLVGRRWSAAQQTTEDEITVVPQVVSTNDMFQPLLRLAKQQVQFPAGLQVSALSAHTSNSTSEPPGDRIECDAAPGTECRLKAPLMRLASGLGVDFDRKSVQTSLVETNRLHSAINALGLMSTGLASFEAASMELRALDEVLLLSRNSFVSV